MNEEIKLAIEGYNNEKLSIQQQIKINNYNKDSNIYNNARLTEIDKVILDLLTKEK